MNDFTVPEQFNPFRDVANNVRETLMKELSIVDIDKQIKNVKAKMKYAKNYMQRQQLSNELRELAIKKSQLQKKEKN